MYLYLYLYIHFYIYILESVVVSDSSSEEECNNVRVSLPNSVLPVEEIRIIDRGDMLTDKSIHAFQQMMKQVINH